ncbi:DinB superfamily protein [compost metagenome]
MSVSKQLAQHLRDVHFGKNWSWSNLKDALDGLSWQEAQVSVQGLNSIALLTVHITYYVKVIYKVLEGGPLEGNDQDSFMLPDIKGQSDWNALQEQIWQQAELTASAIEKMDDVQLDEIFSAAKYGTSFRNIAGMIEHMHYHLGQIVLIRKLLAAQV